MSVLELVKLQRQAQHDYQKEKLESCVMTILMFMAATYILAHVLVAYWLGRW